MLANDPLLWLGVSTALLAVSAAAVVLVSIPVILKFSKTAQSAERLLETLNQELPATLEALRSTGEELANLTEELGDGVESAKSIVNRVDVGMDYAEQQWQQAQIISKSAVTGVRTAWSALISSRKSSQSQPEASELDDQVVQRSQSPLPKSQTIAQSHLVDSESLSSASEGSVQADYAPNAQNVSTPDQAKTFPNPQQ